MENMDWKNGLLDAMDDDKFIDFHLVGTDNLEISCIKLVLAMQSPVFKAMFYGEFEERETDRKSLDYHSSIIKAVVKYCHAGDIDLSFILDKNETTNAEIKLLVELRDAGRYFQLDKVSVHAEREIADAVFRKKDSGHVCSAVLTELLTRGEDSGPFWDAFFHFALEKPVDCFGRKSSDDGSNSVADHPHPKLLARVLENISDTYVLVQCLQAWSTYESNDNKTTGIEKDSLVAISKRVDLKKLSKFQLTKVKPCPLFPAEQLLEACVHHLNLSQPEETSSTYFSTTKIYVTGSGVESADGHYEQDDYQKNYYFKLGEYGGIPCKYKIYFDSGGTRWRMSMRMEESSTERRSIHLYEASPLLEGDVPFNDWKCLEGTEPAPIVATISMRKKSPQNPGGFTFGHTPSSGTFGLLGQTPSSGTFGSTPRSQQPFQGFGTPL